MDIENIIANVEETMIEERRMMLEERRIEQELEQERSKKASEYKLALCAALEEAAQEILRGAKILAGKSKFLTVRTEGGANPAHFMNLGYEISIMQNKDEKKDPKDKWLYPDCHELTVSFDKDSEIKMHLYYRKNDTHEISRAVILKERYTSHVSADGKISIDIPTREIITTMTKTLYKKEML